MIDIHCHILPGLDDGPQTIDESIAMAKVAAQDGIRTIVAAPHIRPGMYEPTAEEVTDKTRELAEALEQAQVPIKIIPAMDAHIMLDLLERLMAGKILTIGNKVNHRDTEEVSSLSSSPCLCASVVTSERNTGSLPVSYVLLELPNDRVPHQVDDLFRDCLFKRYIPILVHPERILEVQKDLERLERWVEMGVLAQVTAASLTGGFGKKAQRTAKKMIEHCLCHLIASEAHNSEKHPPVLSEALGVAAGVIGEEAAHGMVHELPERILSGEFVEPPEPVSIQSKRWWRLK